MFTSSRIQLQMHVLVLVAWLILLVLIVTHQLIHSVSLDSAALALTYCIPLLLPLPGLLRRHRYTYKWATLCVLPYFIVGVTEAVANPAIHAWAVSLLGASLLWFFAMIGSLRVTSTQ